MFKVVVVLLLCFSGTIAGAQQRLITARVIDSATNQRLAFANVVFKNMQKGT